MKINPKAIGEKSEGMVLAKFLQLGWIVLLPFGDNQRYDFVIDRGKGFEKIQVKTARIHNECILFNSSSSQNHRGKGTKGYKGECDFFVVYCPSNVKIYMISVNDCGESTVTLRLKAPKNKQIKHVRFAENYEL